MKTARELSKELDEIKAALQERQLSPAELERVAVSVERLRLLVPTTEKNHDITELKGLGKEFWRAIDVEKYLQEERDSWR